MEWNQSKEVLEKQLCADYSISPALLQSEENIFVPMHPNPSRRVFRDKDSFLKVLSYRNKLIICCKDDSMLSWCREKYKNSPAEWFAKYENLRILDQKLKEYGHKIGDTHHYYIPGKNWKKTDFHPSYNDYVLYLLEKSDLLPFKGNPLFTNALSFDPKAPDVLAIAAISKNNISADSPSGDWHNKICGMAGASMDSPLMWQIGIDVLKNARSSGLATYLVWHLAEEIDKRNILPFYGTSESHNHSKAVAFRCGFVPTWWELYSESVL